MIATTENIAFRGIIGFVDTPSNRAPSGARGHRIALSRTAVEEAIGKLAGMTLDFRKDTLDYKKDPFDTPSIPVGVIEGASIISGNAIEVSGFVWPGARQVFTSGADKMEDLAMCFDLKEVHIKDMRDAVWDIDGLEFTGVAVIPGYKAAFKGTCFWLETSDLAAHSRGI